jgi:YidC/Oxa1 family membrane protein insertase
MQQRNFLIFIVLAFLIMVGYTQLRVLLWKQPVPAQVEPAGKDEAAKEEPAAQGQPASRGDGMRFALGAGGAQAVRWLQAKSKKPAPAVVPVTEDSKLIRLGRADRSEPSRFHLDVDLDPRGAGVRRLAANKFQKANKEGRPVWIDKEAKEPAPLELIPAGANTETPAFALYAYDQRDLADEHPLDTLGHSLWTAIIDKNGNPITEEQTKDGRTKQSVSFRAEVDDFTITKTFSLAEEEYHLGLEVTVSRKKETADSKERTFRYQLAGGRGLPVEGEWYTNTFRNALIARVDRGTVYRDLQDLRQIALMEGGNEIARDKNLVLRYAGVVVQYFASVIAVDEDQKRVDFLRSARPTLEIGVAKGKLKSISADKETLVLSLGDRGDQTFHVPKGSDLAFKLSLFDLHEGQPLAIEYRTDGIMEEGHFRSVVIDVLPQAETQPIFLDDITVRVATESFELKPGMDVTHKYVLYNGPVKAMLLGQLTGEKEVPPEVVDRYLNGLYLNTLTDYQSPGFFGKISSSIYWSQLIIHCTNIMHEILNLLHRLIPNYGICIIVLTVLVRGLMFPVSRKQAMTSMRMQELAPELKKLQEKYKEDKQALGMAQLDLYRKHGVNPVGSCWFLLLQMPIFMGLYYSLQESIHFRLADLWPTWIINLAAPDMLIYWGPYIPFLSRPEDYGGFLYLGPYFNLLPVIAVSLMLVQQKMTMPPPTDEQQEMQQKMMKYMMIVFGLMFYKVAAGLCIYFVSSSLWGFAERKLLPKKKPKDGDVSSESLFQRIINRADNGSRPAGSEEITTGPATSSAVTSEARRDSGPSMKRRRGKRRGELGTRVSTAAANQAEQATGLSGWWRVLMEKLAAWWQEILRQAEKKR